MAKSPCLIPSITSEPRLQARMVPLNAWNEIDMAIVRITIATISSSSVKPLGDSGLDLGVWSLKTSSSRCLHRGRIYMQ